MSARTKASRTLVLEPVKRIPEVPSYVAAQYGSARAFKATKRAQLKAARQAMHKVYIGCGFFPGGSSLARKIEDLMDALVTDLSVKAWGR